MGNLAFEQPCHRNLGEFRGPGASRDHAKTSWSGCHRLMAYAMGKNQRTNSECGGQLGWDWGFPAFHRPHSGTGRKDTHNGKRCGN